MMQLRSSWEGEPRIPEEKVITRITLRFYVWLLASAQLHEMHYLLLHTAPVLSFQSGGGFLEKNNNSVNQQQYDKMES